MCDSSMHLCSLTRSRKKRFFEVAILIFALLFSSCQLPAQLSGKTWTSTTYNIVFKSNRDDWMRNRTAEIWVTDEKGKHVLPVPHSTMGDPWLSAPAWSHDGQKLIFSVLTKLGTGLALLSVDAKDFVLIADSASSGDWSPDDKLVVYYSYDTRSINLFDMETESSQLAVQDLPKLFGEYPRISWAAYDNLIAFDMPDMDGNWSIYLLDLITSEAEPLIYGRHPDFSPIRHEIAYVQDGQIRRLDLQSMQSYAITDDKKQNATWPSWSPDGEKLVFSLNRKAEVWNLYTVNRDGSEMSQITSDEVADITPDWRPLNP